MPGPPGDEVRKDLSPFDPSSDWHLICLYIITPESNIKVARIKEMITYFKKLLIV